MQQYLEFSVGLSNYQLCGTMPDFLVFVSSSPEKIKNSMFVFPWKSLQGTNSRKKKSLIKTELIVIPFLN